MKSAKFSRFKNLVCTYKEAIMFGSLLKIGSKLLGGMRIGSKFLGKAGKLGTKVAAGANRAFNVASGLPIVGHAIGQSPIMQGMRGVVGGLDRVSKMSTAAGDVLERGASGTQSMADTGRRLHGMAKSARGEVRYAQGQARRTRDAGRSLYHRGRAHGASMFNQHGGDTDHGTTLHS